jgi:formate dehydrogenase major subunit
MQVTRRQFFKICGAGLGASSVAYLGFSPEPALAEVRAFKLAHTKESRSICPYCSVSCGVLMHTMGSGAKNAHSSIVHIEGDPDNPVNRGTLCPKGAGLLDMIKSESRLKQPEYRAPGGDQWQTISWDEAFTKIARLMKDDRDANFVVKNDKGELVNRWISTGFLASSAASNESGYLTHKVVRSFGMAALDTQARI